MTYISSILTVGLVLAAAAYSLFGSNPYVTNKVMETISGRKSTENMKDPASLKGERFYVPREKRDVRVNLYRMHEGLPVMYFAHGGSFIDKDADTYDDLCAEMAQRLDVAIVSISYSKFDAHRTTYPQAEIRDAMVYFGMHGKEFGIDVTKPLMAGMEAGAYLILQSGISAVQKGVLAAGYILIDPYIDYVCISLAQARQHPGPAALLFSDRDQTNKQDEYLMELEKTGIDMSVKNMVLYKHILDNIDAEGDAKAARDGVYEWLRREVDMMLHRYSEEDR